MSINKKTAVRLSRLAHMLIALILADIVPSIFSRILLLVSIGVICGVQSICINCAVLPRETSTANNHQVNTEATEGQAESTTTASILENKDFTN